MYWLVLDLSKEVHAMLKSLVYVDEDFGSTGANSCDELQIIIKRTSVWTTSGDERKRT